ncbi:MAG: HincII family type II restriction endonuclease [Flavobacterium sp.]|nr:HincII family type II restriction endonuclease [Flavobacterium sp.]
MPDIYLFVKEEIEKQFPLNTYGQKEYLFYLFTKEKNEKILNARKLLFANPSVHFLLNMKVDDIEDNPFDEKQDDTANILVVKDGFYEIIDIKTRNLSKTAQAPNIISSFKLAQMCAIMIDNKEFDNFSINYFEVDWVLENEKLVCKDAHFVSLFKSTPDNLYINWAAAMQIQFHVCNLDQDFKGTIEQWAKEYLKHFVTQVYRRSEYKIKKFAKPFEKYID